MHRGVIVPFLLRNKSNSSLTKFHLTQWSIFSQLHFFFSLSVPNKYSMNLHRLKKSHEFQIYSIYSVLKEKSKKKQKKEQIYLSFTEFFKISHHSRWQPCTELQSFIYAKCIEEYLWFAHKYKYLSTRSLLTKSPFSRNIQSTTSHNYL